MERIGGALKDAETGQRGFLITGEDSYLAPYTAAAKDIKGLIDHVGELTADNAAQQELIAALRPLVEIAGSAEQTSREMTGRVHDIQLSASATSEAIGRVSDIVSRVNDYQMTIASAVEEQTATTSEMARNVHEASVSSRTVSGSLSTVSAAVSETATAIDASERAVGELAGMSSTLHGLVGQFKS